MFGILEEIPLSKLNGPSGLKKITYFKIINKNCNLLAVVYLLILNFTQSYI